MYEFNIVLIARLLIGFLFVFTALNNLSHHQLLIDIMRERRIYFSAFSFYIKVLIELIAGICVTFGFEIIFAASILIVFVIVSNLIFNDFWNEKSDFHRVQCMAFMTNLSIIAALLLLIEYYR